MQPLNSRGLSANTLFHFTSSLDNLINIVTMSFILTSVLKASTSCLRNQSSNLQFLYCRSVISPYRKLDFISTFMVIMGLG
jgi:hypothetical protein